MEQNGSDTGLDVEILLISKILETGEIKPVIDSGLKVDQFISEDVGAWFQWIFDYYRDPAHPQAIPTLEVFKLNFPKALFPDVNARLSLLEAIELVKKKQLQGEMRTIGERLFTAADSEDFQELKLEAEEAQKGLSQLLCRSKKEDINFFSSTTADITGIYESNKKSCGFTGVFWPWDIVNEKAGPMEDKSLGVLHGRPKQLKTWVGTAIAGNYYKLSFSGRVLIYSCEMPVVIMRQRLACYLSKVDYHRFRKGSLLPDEEERFYTTLYELEQSELNSCTNGHKKEMIITKPSDLSLLDLQSKIESYGPDLVVVDGVQYLADGKGAAKSDKNAQAELSRGLKETADSYNLPILAIHQSNRERDSGYLEDLAFSDQWGRDPDFILRVTRIQTTNIGQVLALMFGGSREFNLTGVLVHGKPAVNFDCIDEIATMKRYDELVSGEKEVKSRGKGGMVSPNAKVTI